MKTFARRAAAALFLLLALCALCVGASAADDGYTIDNYRFEGVLSENNVMHVVETEEVTFHEPRHGIIRSIPTEFKIGAAAPEIGGSRNMSYRTRVRNVRVVEAPFKVSREDDYANIRIGDADRTVTGKQVYTISYDYVMPDDRLDSCDFLFYSVLGAENTTDVGAFSFSIRFEKPIPEASLEKLRVYSGRMGSTGNDLDVECEITQDEISGHAEDIRPGRAITVLLVLPDGYFVGAWRVSVLPALAAAVGGLLAGLWGLLRALFTRKKRAVQTVEFYPPEGLTSADVGMIIDGNADDIDMLSLIPAWAEQGYLTIEQVTSERGFFHKKLERGLILRRLRALPNDAPEHEKLFFQALFGNDGVRDLTEHVELDFAGKLDAAKRALSNRYTGDRALRQGMGSALLCTFIPAVFFALLIGFHSPVEFEFGNLMMGLWAMANLIGVGVIALRFHLGKVQTWGKRVLWGLAIAVLLLMPLWITAACVSEEIILPEYAYWASLALATLCALMGGRMIQPTDYRLQYEGQLMGLKNFIRTAEVPRLKLLLEETPSYFFKILPYAMVFGLADQWAAHFETLTLEPPSWYYGYDGYWDYYMMTNTLDRSLREPVRDLRTRARQEAVASAASSDSGGGGGFSGGGGGGGGTSSW